MSTIFSKIINRELPAKIIYEDDRIIAIEDKFPQSKGHFLVIPKKFAVNLEDINDDELTYLMLKARELAKKQIKHIGVSGFNLVVNSGKSAGQEIMHIHVHIVPAKK